MKLRERGQGVWECKIGTGAALDAHMRVHARKTRLLDLETDCLSAVQDVLCLECPISGIMFASCCKHTQLYVTKPTVLGVKAKWTADRWVFKCASSPTGGRFDSRSVCVATKAVFTDSGSESVQQFTSKVLPMLTNGIALKGASPLVHNTCLLFFDPRAPPVRFTPPGALLKHRGSGLYTVHYHAFELRFESRLFCNNNAMPHRDNNDYDKWMEVHMHRLVRLSYSRVPAQ